MALAAPHVRIEAEVDPDLARVRGTLRLSGDPAAVLVDPLAALPMPTDDLWLPRTFPGRPDRGQMTFAAAGDGVWTFETRLPRRFGDVGATRHGLFANGAWYPQPLVDGHVPIATWEVAVRLPEGVIGALGDGFGTTSLAWSGAGERASLAVLPGGVATPLPVDGATVVLLTRKRPRARLARELDRRLTTASQEGTRWQGVVVEAPLRRRLVRPGRGLAYVSDRLWRVTPGAQRFHHVAATRGLVAALTPQADPFLRDLAGAAVADHVRLAGPDARAALRAAAWIPTIDAILNDRTLPFYADVLEEVHPGDPVRDDLLEALDPHAPGPAVVAQLDDTFGPGTAWRVASPLLSGAPPDTSGLPQGWLDAWRAPYPRQDYELEVVQPRVTVLREAPEGSPVESAFLVVNGDRHLLTLAPGESATVEVPDAVRAAVLDPGGHLAQTSRSHDAWPTRFNLTMAGWVETLNVTDLYLEAGGAMWLRRRYDNRNLYWGSLETSRENIVAARLGYTRRIGTPMDGLRRPHRVTGWLSPAWLDPRYAESDGRLALGGGLSWVFDDRRGHGFPLRGSDIGIGADGGVVPGTDERWGAVRTSFGGIVSPHPRHAVAVAGSLGLAGGNLEHRLLPLGGMSGLRSLPPGTAIGGARAIGRVEYRWAVLRDLSVPFGFAWLSGADLTVGAEGGATDVDGETAAAVGLTAGAAVHFDWIGMNPDMFGFTAAWPARTWGVEAEAGWPEIYLRWSQAF